MGQPCSSPEHPRVCTGLLPACLWAPGGLSPACGPWPLGCEDNVKEPSSIWATSLGPLATCSAVTVFRLAN